MRYVWWNVYIVLIESFLLSPLVKEFLKSVKIWESYCQKFDGFLFGIWCILCIIIMYIICYYITGEEKIKYLKLCWFWSLADEFNWSTIISNKYVQYFPIKCLLQCSVVKSELGLRPVLWQDRSQTSLDRYLARVCQWRFHSEYKQLV